MINREKALMQIQNEYQLGKNFVTQKRERIRDRMASYRNITDQKDKVYDRIIRTIVKTWIAINYNDKKAVSFTGRDGKVGSDTRAKIIDSLAEFDFDEMGGPEKEYRYLEDMALKGVGIKVGGLRDDVVKAPEYRVVDPLSWIPDPYSDVNTGPRFHGFELEIARSELHGGGFFEIDKVKSKTEQAIDRYIDDKLVSGGRRSDFDNDQWIIQQRELATQERDIKGNEIYSVYMHFTQIGGKKYMFTLANDRTLFIGVKEIKAVREEEKKDSRKIPFPVVATNISPIQDDPFGESFFDILEDKQAARQLLINLEVIKAKHGALGDTYFVDKTAISNPDQLRQKTTGTKFIFADLQRNPNPVRPLDKPNIKTDTYNMVEQLKGQAMLETNLDEGSLGVAGTAGRTAAENIRLQKNTNLRMLLDKKMLLIGEKKFWDVLWYRVYQENFKAGQKKQILISSGLGRVPQVIQKDDFNTLGDVYITIDSKSDVEQRKEKDGTAFMANAGIFLQNSGSEFSKNHVLRRLATLSGMSEEESYVVIPETFDEMNAKLDLELINRNEEASQVESGQDHTTYLAIYEQAYNTPAKLKAIAARRMALMKDKQLQTQPPQQQDQSSALQNQATITNQMLQQGNSTPSLQDLGTQNG